MWCKKPYKKDFPITSPYGMRHHPITGVQKKHKGVDVGMPEGTELYASFSGDISSHIDKKGLDKGFGLYSILDGVTEAGSPVRMIFAHLSEVTIEGEIKEGELIAKSGNSGSSTGAHLHLQLEVYKAEIGWITIDPIGSIDFSVGV